MNATDTKRFEELYKRYEAGDRESALHALREFAQDIAEPWEKAELIYHETLWLLDLEEFSDARRSLERLKREVAALMPGRR